MNFLNFSLLVDAVVEVADDCISRQLERILRVDIEASTEEDVHNLLAFYDEGGSGCYAIKFPSGSNFQASKKELDHLLSDCVLSLNEINEGKHIAPVEEKAFLAQWSNMLKDKVSGKMTDSLGILLKHSKETMEMEVGASNALAEINVSTDKTHTFPKFK